MSRTQNRPKARYKHAALVRADKNWSELSALGIDPVVRMGSVTALVGLSASKIFALVATGRFPRGFHLIPGGRARGWRLSEIDAWVRDRESSERALP